MLPCINNYYHHFGLFSPFFSSYIYSFSIIKLGFCILLGILFLRNFVFEYFYDNIIYKQHIYKWLYDI